MTATFHRLQLMRSPPADDGSVMILIEGQEIATVYNTERAELIVRAVNSHADLLAALEACLRNDRESVFMDADVSAKAIAAVRKAKGDAA